jgi:hypothetical protein
VFVASRIEASSPGILRRARLPLEMRYTEGYREKEEFAVTAASVLEHDRRKQFIIVD